MRTLACIVLPVFQPQDEFLREQIFSIVAQKEVAVKIFFVIADCNSTSLVNRLVIECGVNSYAILEPLNKLNSVMAFEFGLEHVNQMRKELPPFIVALSDQDDVWHPMKLCELRDKLVETGAALVHSDAQIVDQKYIAYIIFRRLLICLITHQFHIACLKIVLPVSLDQIE